MSIPFALKLSLTLRWVSDEFIIKSSAGKT